MALEHATVKDVFFIPEVHFAEEIIKSNLKEGDSIKLDLEDAADKLIVVISGSGKTKAKSK